MSDESNTDMLPKSSPLSPRSEQSSLNFSKQRKNIRDLVKKALAKRTEDDILYSKQSGEPPLPSSNTTVEQSGSKDDEWFDKTESAFMKCLLDTLFGTKRKTTWDIELEPGFPPSVSSTNLDETLHSSTQTTSVEGVNPEAKEKAKKKDKKKNKKASKAIVPTRGNQRKIPSKQKVEPKEPYYQTAEFKEFMKLFHEQLEKDKRDFQEQLRAEARRDAHTRKK